MNAQTRSQMARAAQEHARNLAEATAKAAAVQIGSNLADRLTGNSGDTREENKRIREERGDGAPGPVESNWKGDKGIIMHKHRRMRVNKRFRDQVESIIDGRNVSGFKIDRCFYSLISSNADVQVVDAFVSSHTANAAPTRWDFTPEYFLDAASVLWNGKSQTWEEVDYTTGGNNGWGPRSPKTLGMTLLDGTGTGWNITDLRVINSYAEYKVTNHTERTLSIDVYDCAPKQHSCYSYNTIGAAAGATVIESSAVLDPPQCWDIALSNQNSVGENIGDTQITELDMTPAYSPEFSQQYRWTKKDCILEPGTTLYFKIQGPENLDLDVNQQFVNGVWMQVAPYSRYPMFVVKPDTGLWQGGDVTTPSFNSVGAGGRPPLSYAHLAPYTAGVVMERRLYCSLSMPENVGTTLPATYVAGDILPLNKRRKAFSIKTWVGAHLGYVLHGNKQLADQDTTQA